MATATVAGRYFEKNGKNLDKYGVNLAAATLPPEVIVLPITSYSVSAWL